MRNGDVDLVLGMGDAAGYQDDEASSGRACSN